MTVLTPETVYATDADEPAAAKQGRRTAVKFRFLTEAAVDAAPAWQTGDPENRAGTSPALAGASHWTGRHSGRHGEDTGVASEYCTRTDGDPRRQCVHVHADVRCCEHANAEDGMCGPCRRWCG